MNLVFNTGMLAPPLSGIGNYAFHLLQEFSTMSEIENIGCFDGLSWLTLGEQLELMSAEPEASPLPKSTNRKLSQTILRKIPMARWLREAQRNRNFRTTLPFHKNTIYHEPNIIIKPCSIPTVTTIHDLSFIHYPQFHPPQRVAWLAKQLPKTLAKSDFVITDCELVRTELMDRYGVPEDRSKAIYLGADKNFKPRSALQTINIMERFQLKHKKFILFVGTLEPRKGLEILLDAWLLLPSDLRNEYPLVIAGASGWLNTSLQDRLNILSQSEPIHHLAFVSQYDLPKLYSAATVLASPSIYEGFGLSVLEAMASGTPAICRTGTSMEEFAQEGCILCNTGDVEELLENLQKVLENKVFCDTYISRGLLKSEQFSWKDCAQDTLNVYKEIL